MEFWAVLPYTKQIIRARGINPYDGKDEQSVDESEEETKPKKVDETALNKVGDEQAGNEQAGDKVAD